MQIQEQVNELKGQLGALISRSCLESLKRRLLYAAGHTYGRCTQLACQLLRKFDGEGASGVKVTAELVHVTAEALDILLSAGVQTEIGQGLESVPAIAAVHRRSGGRWGRWV